MTSRRRSVLLLVPVLALAACGGGGGGSASSGSVPADPNLTVIAEDIHFDQKAYSVPAGEVRIAYPNKGQQTHTLVVQSPAGDKIDPKLSVAPGKETGGVYQLQPGVYTIYCDITGHREAGMVATLTVG